MLYVLCIHLEYYGSFYQASETLTEELSCNDPADATNYQQSKYNLSIYHLKTFYLSAVDALNGCLVHAMSLASYLIF